ncbi:MAG: hypothetical protein V2A34_15985, partial [Lentisphaerota bacterium]
MVINTNLAVTGTSNFQDISFVNATAVSVTSTNIFANNLNSINVSTTNLVVSNSLIVPSGGNINSSDLTWINATGTYTTSTNLFVSDYARLPIDTRINNTQLCLADGTNCPAGGVGTLQQVTDLGNTTTNTIQFAGGTSTDSFMINMSQDDVTTLFVSNTSTASNAMVGSFLTNGTAAGGLILTGSGNQNSPNMLALFADQNAPGMIIDVENPTGTIVFTNQLMTQTPKVLMTIDATGTVELTNQLLLAQYATMPISGKRPGAIIYNTSSSAPYFWNGGMWVALASGTGTIDTDTLQSVTNRGNTTTNTIQFAGGTSTGNFIPSIGNMFSLGGPGKIWQRVWAESLMLTTATSPSSWKFSFVPDNSLSIGNPSTSAMNIAYNGFVGIGTSTPQNILHVSQKLDGFSFSKFENQTTNGSSTAGILVQDGTQTGGMMVLSASYTNMGLGALAGDTVVFSGGPMGKGKSLDLVADSASGSIALFTGSNGPPMSGFQRMIIDSSGNVGIGTSAPQAILHVSRKVDGFSASTFENTSTGTEAAGGIMLKNGNYGGYLMAVSDNYNGSGVLSNLAGHTVLMSGGPGGLMNRGIALASTDANGNIVFFTGSNGPPTNDYERLRINSAGNVGIGTTSPTAFRLQVAGNIGPSSTNAYDLGSATGSWRDVYASGTVRVGTDVVVNGSSVCLQNGTNCPAGGVGTLQQVTNAGNSTTNTIQFAGGTSTGDFSLPNSKLAIGTSTFAGRLNVAGDANINGNLALIGSGSPQVLFTNSDGSSSSTISYNAPSQTIDFSAIPGGVNFHGGEVYIMNDTVPVLYFASQDLSKQAQINYDPSVEIMKFTGATNGKIIYNHVGIGGWAPNDFNLEMNGTIGPAITDNFDFGSATLSWRNIYASGTSHLANVSTTNLTVNGVAVCLQDGTNCPAATGDSVWSDNVASNFIRPATTTRDVVIGASASATAPFYFDVGSPSSSFQIGRAGNADLLVGTSTYGGGLDPLFVMNGDDVLVQGQLGSIGGLFSATSVIVGGGSTIYGDGLINKNNGNLVLQTSGGYIIPQTDLGQTLGSPTQRFNAQMGDVTSTNLITANADISLLTVSTGTIGDLFATAATLTNLVVSEKITLPPGGSMESGGEIVLTSAPLVTSTGWVTSNAPSVGIESVRSLQGFNGFLYAGQGDSAGDGDISVCNPAAAGDT